MEIRNIAIIAHVDHGKTTLTDALLRQNGMADEHTSMDSNDLEQERGITIYAKNTSLFYKDTKINIVDTPGHADFGSEVERVLRSIDTVMLLVDAQEGPMPQTRFVLKKSIELGLKPIVVINKIDKPAADPAAVHDMVMELFLELGASEEQFEFTTVYAIGIQGIAMKNLDDESKDLSPLLDTIIEEVKPSVPEPNKTGVAQVFNLAYDNFLGRMAACRVYGGQIKASDTITVLHPGKEPYAGKITKLFTFEGTEKKETEVAENGDIVMIAGFPEIFIGDTISNSEETEAMPAIGVDEPTISMNFLLNDSPFAGREGKYVTGRQIRERLEKELEVNVGLKVDFSRADYYTVYGRGELHIGVLLENMRREGFEVQVSQPHVVIKEVDGEKMEPFEEVTVDVLDEVSGTVIEKLNLRKGLMMDMQQKDGRSRIIFHVPTRGLLGFRGQFVIDTKGDGIISSRFIEFRPYAGEVARTKLGSMISMESGKALAFALNNLQKRGVLYISPGEEIYEGMVVGNVNNGEDLYVNPSKGKQLTNMRASGSDEGIFLTPPFVLDIERAMEIIADDEYIEITPKSVRMRKIYLNKSARDKAMRDKIKTK